MRAVEGESADPTPATASFEVEATPPQTTINSAPSGRVPIGTVFVDFSSDQAGASFECSLDGGSFSSCASPYELPGPEPGPHDFEVRAVNGAGVVDPSPDSADWSSVEPEHDLCGSIDRDTTIGPDYAAVYVMTCDLTVEEGAALTVEPGAIVKAGGGVSLEVNGSLNAIGTAAEPVTFTSAKDTSIGGDTAPGEVNDGSPAAGDWAGIYAPGGSIDLRHSRVAYGGPVGGTGMGSLIATNDTFESGQGFAELIAESESATVEDDSFHSPSQSAAIVSSPDLKLSGNAATGVSVGDAYWADSSALDFAGLSSNFADHGGLAVSGEAASSEWSGSLPLLLETGGEGFGGYRVTARHLAVPAGKALTLAPGTVVKAQGWDVCHDTSCSLEVNGSLNAIGTAAEPVTFTSAKDTSIGGDTAPGEVNDGSPAAGDWAGIYAPGGSIDLRHSRVAYGGPVGGTGMGSLIATNDTFESGQGFAELIAESESATVEDDSFHSPSQSAAIVSSPDLKLSGNAATGVSVGDAYWADSSALDFAGLSSNFADHGGLAVSGEAASSEWSGSLPLLLETGGEGFGGYRVTARHLAVPAGKALTLAPGTVVKAQGWDVCHDTSCSLEVNGSLNAIGTAAEPVTFTSAKDTSIGGDTAPGEVNDGSPAAGDWAGIYAPGGSIDLRHSRVAYGGPVGGTGMGSLIATNDTFESGQGFAELIAESESATVEDDSFHSPSQSAAIVSSPDLKLSGNAATGVSVGDAYWADSSALDFAGLSSNFADHGGLAVSGEAASSEWSGSLPLLLETGGEGFGGYRVTARHLAVPAGKALTLAPGTVVKAQGWDVCHDTSCSLEVNGSLNAIGTAAEPVTFTSAKDTSIGGDTAPGEVNDGSPAAGDWAGIHASTSASLVLEHAMAAFASTAIDDSAGSSSQVKIDSDAFSSNATAMSVSAAVTSNLQVEDNDFNENGVAINASSNWSTLTADPADCAYVPSMDATGNTFDGSSAPLVSASDYAIITGTGLASSFGVAGVKEYPDGWADDVQEGSQDTITVHYEPCYDVTEPDNSYVAIAIPLNLDPPIHRTLSRAIRPLPS